MHHYSAQNMSYKKQIRLQYTLCCLQTTNKLIGLDYITLLSQNCWRSVNLDQTQLNTTCLISFKDKMVEQSTIMIEGEGE